MKSIGRIGILFLALLCGTLGACSHNNALETARTITVTNNTSADIWIGITASALSCATTPAGGSDALCPTQAAGSCGNGGITCVGGPTGAWCGDYPWNRHNGFCYQKSPIVSNSGGTGTQLKPGTSLTLTAPTVSDAAQFVWSGNLFAQTGCDSSGNNCQIGDCTKDSNGMCPPGTSGAPPGTLAELTLVNPAFSGTPPPGKDFYDISIINAVNVAAIVGPIGAATTASSPYECTSAGSTVAQGPLPACSWSINPKINNIDYSNALGYVALPTPAAPAKKQGQLPSGAKCPGVGGPPPISPNPDRYCQCPGSTKSNLVYPNADGYCPDPNNVKEYPNSHGYFKTCNSNTEYPNSAGYCPCTSSSQCGSQTCGVALITSSASSTYAQVCGEFIGWTTADTLCSFYAGSISRIPPFLQPLCNPPGASHFSVIDYLGCTGTGATSCYNIATESGYQKTCCGCGTSTASRNKFPGVWPTAQTGSGPASNGGCYGNSKDWNDYVQPSLVYLKQACPTAYVYPFDDATSTFTCKEDAAGNRPNYQVTFESLK